MSKYTLTLPDGTTFDLLPGESDGPGATSMPVRPLNILAPNIVVIAGDATSRYVAGFEFDLRDVDPTSPSPLAGTYTVASSAYQDPVTVVQTTADIIPSGTVQVYPAVPPVDVIPNFDPQDPTLYQLRWKVAGNITAEFSVGGRFLAIDNVTKVPVTHVLTGIEYDATNNLTSLFSVTQSSGTPVVPQNVTISRIITEQFGVAIQYEGEAHTSLQLTGTNVVRYNDNTTWGNALMQNLINLLGNNAGATAPPIAVVGQAWYDTTVNQIKHFNGTDWN